MLAVPTEVDPLVPDVFGTVRRKGMQATLTSLFPIDQMTAAEREREDAAREGVDLRGSVMPLEVLKDESGKAVALKMCECEMEGMKPIPKEGTEFRIALDQVVDHVGRRLRRQRERRTDHKAPPLGEGVSGG